jgi:hypothetical protein
MAGASRWDVRHLIVRPSSCWMQGRRSTAPAEAITARQAYFKALLKHWPEPLSALRDEVLPIYEPCWSVEDAPEERRAQFESWDQLQNDSARVALLKALRQWAPRFRVTEGWIFQTALDTLQAYSNTPTAPFYALQFEGSKPAWFWWYAPREPYLRFQPRLHGHSIDDIWYPATDWNTFRSRMVSRFTTQLDEYRRMVEMRFATRRIDTLTRDAEWTARYQKGESAIEITEAAALIGYQDDAQAVFKAIERFSRLIGLNLRRRGVRVPRETSVQPKR